MEISFDRETRILMEITISFDMLTLLICVSDVLSDLAKFAQKTLRDSEKIFWRNLPG